MTGALGHRGPDHTGIHIDGAVGLGHTRLSILDTSELGHQPMHTGAGQSIVFNGEIYNFKKLRNTLASGGGFVSRSDTEVLLHGLASRGETFLQELEGMFAFAYWDSATKTLLLARDRMGQKPLYYAALPDRFLFASEPQAILQDPDFRAEPNLGMLYHYLSVQSCPAPGCAFRSMSKLAPGEALAMRDGVVRRWRYWEPRFTQRDMPESQAVDELVDLLRTSVSNCLVSDVPLGLFLSGGVDSSLIAALAAEVAPHRMNSYTIGFDNQAYDERRYAREIAEHCGLNYHELVVEPDPGILPVLVRRYGEPFADPSALPTYYLSEFTRQNVTVALSGDGGDDLFAGYERHLNPWLYPDMKSLPPQRLEELRRELPYVSGRERGQEGAQERERLLGAGLFFYYRYWARFYGRFKQRLCTEAFMREAAPALSVDLFLGGRNFPTLSDTNKIIEFELQYYLASTLMPKVDIMSMTHSLEVRAPLLEPPVVEFACSLPDAMKIRRTATGNGKEAFTSKYLLKKAAERFLPKRLIHRPKMGFGVPIGDWFRSEFKELLYDSLLCDRAVDRGYFNKPFVEELIDRHMRGENLQYPLWTLLMMELWHRRYIDAG